MVRPLVRGCRIAAPRERECGIENVFSFLEERRSRPEKRSRFRGRRQCGCVVSRMEARFQLADPIEAGGERQLRGALQMSLEPALIELVVVEGAEVRCQATKGLDDPELPNHDVDAETEPCLPCPLQPMISFTLCIIQRSSADEEVGDEVVVAVDPEGHVARFLCDGDRAP